MNKYSTEEKQQAIDLYFKNGCNMKKTVRELGYGSATGILRWLMSHGDRDGGSKCVTTGSICVPNKKSESSRKELSGFFSLFECNRVCKEQKFVNLIHQGH